jgi:hypothetical protein
MADCRGCGVKLKLIEDGDGAVYIDAMTHSESDCLALKLSEYQLSLGKARQHLELERETSNRIAAELDATKSRLDQVTRERDQVALASKAVYALADVTAERDSLLLRLNEYRKLCPSVQDLETGEQLHPESTVTVGLGYLRKLIEDRDFLNEHSPYQTCARCGEEFRTLEMTWEEGDEMECLPCNERENARERAEIQAGGVETHAHNLGEQK